MNTTHSPTIRIARIARSLPPVAAALLLAALLFTPAAQAAPAARTAPLHVTVSILPQKYFTERIAGDRAEIAVMVQPGAEPATYEPKPKQMAALSHADLYLAVGVPFEHAWLDRILAANPDMRVVDVSMHIKKMSMAAHHHHEGMEHHGEMEGHGGMEGHEHDADMAAGPEGHMQAHHAGDHDGGHQHPGGADPHVWLAPDTARILCTTTAEALAITDPDGAPVYAANLKKLLADIDALDAEIKGMMKDLPRQRGFLVYHPAWGYFARAYGLTQVPIETEGKEPSPRELAELVHHAREEGLKTIFVQSQFSERSARTVADEIGATVVRLDPLAEDWPGHLRRAARAIADSMHQSAN